MSIFETTVTDGELEDLRRDLDSKIAKFTIIPGMSPGYFEFSQQKCLIVANTHFKTWKKANRSKLSLFHRFAKIGELYNMKNHFRVKLPDGLNAEPML